MSLEVELILTQGQIHEQITSSINHITHSSIISNDLDRVKRNPSVDLRNQTPAACDQCVLTGCAVPPFESITGWEHTEHHARTHGNKKGSAGDKRGQTGAKLGQTGMVPPTRLVGRRWGRSPSRRRWSPWPSGRHSIPSPPAGHTVTGKRAALTQRCSSKALHDINQHSPVHAHTRHTPTGV